MADGPVSDKNPDLIQFDDGPLAGERYGTSKWPPSDEIPIKEVAPGYSGPDGVYVQHRRSQLPEQPADSPLIRGAVYRWREVEA